MPTSSYKFENCVCTKVYLLGVDRKRERKLSLALWTMEFPFFIRTKKRAITYVLNLIKI